MLLDNLSFQGIVGEVKPIAIQVWNSLDPSTDISSTTASAMVFSASGGVTLDFQPATVAGTTLLTVSVSWDLTNVIPGRYRADFTVVNGAVKQIFQVPCLVLPYPAPQ